MSVFLAMLRRSLWLLLLAAAGGAVYAWWRDRDGDDGLATPEWPPLDADSARADGASADALRQGADAGATSKPSAAAPSTPTTDASSSATPSPEAAPTNASATSTSSFVNALVDAPEARSADGTAGGWVEPNDDGSCPLSHPIKANDNSGIFHVPDGRFYERTRAERCYADPDAAVADGYRQAKN